MINRNSTPLNLTEGMRVCLFANADQNQWNELSRKTTNAIAEMILAGKNLYEVYEFARKARTDIAEKLHTKRYFDFGEIRTQECSDFYNTDSFAGAETTDDTFLKNVASIITEQKDLVFIQGYTNTYSTSFRTEPKDNLTIKYIYGHTYTGIAWNGEPCTTHVDRITSVEIKFDEMNEKRYVEKLTEFNYLLDALKKEDCQGEACLKKLAELAYDLSRMNFLIRGTAAVNGCIIRAIGSIKNFEIGNMHVRGLPFDIYAHLQADRNKYIEDFCRDVGHEFNLLKRKSLRSANL